MQKKRFVLRPTCSNSFVSNLPQMLAFHWNMDLESLREQVHIQGHLEFAPASYLQTQQCLLCSPLLQTDTNSVVSEAFSQTLLKLSLGDEEEVPASKCLPHQRGNLSLITRTHVSMWGTVGLTCHANVGGGLGQTDPWGTLARRLRILDGCQDSERPCFQRGGRCS